MRMAIQSASVNRFGVDTVLAEITRAVQAGLSSYWAPMLTGLDTLTVLGVAGREIGGIELGTAVVPMPSRPPFALAQQIATVSELTGGRLLVGFGPSHEALVTKTFGLPWPASPLAATRAYLAELNEITARTTPRRLTTPQAPPTPILLGAVNPAMARLAAELATGVVTWAAGLRTLQEVLSPVRQDAAAGEGFRIVTILPVCVTSDEAAGRAGIQRHLGSYDRFPSYQKVLAREGAASIAELALVGSEQSVAAELDRYAQSGTTDFAAHIVADRDDLDRTWEFLASRVGQH